MTCDRLKKIFSILGINLVVFVILFFVIDYLAFVKMGVDKEDEMILQMPPAKSRIYCPFRNTITPYEMVNKEYYGSMRRPDLLAK